MKIHIVQEGDTLWNISQKYGVDFEQLKSVNTHISNPDMIMPGMKIKIPSAGVPAKKKEEQKPDMGQPYLPQQGKKEEKKVEKPPLFEKDMKPSPKPPSEGKDLKLPKLPEIPKILPTPSKLPSIDLKGEKPETLLPKAQLPLFPNKEYNVDIDYSDIDINTNITQTQQTSEVNMYELPQIPVPQQAPKQEQMPTQPTQQLPMPQMMPMPMFVHGCPPAPCFGAPWFPMAPAMHPGMMPMSQMYPMVSQQMVSPMSGAMPQLPWAAPAGMPYQPQMGMPGVGQWDDDDDDMPELPNIAGAPQAPQMPQQNWDWMGTQPMLQQPMMGMPVWDPQMSGMAPMFGNNPYGMLPGAMAPMSPYMPAGDCGCGGGQRNYGYYDAANLAGAPFSSQYMPPYTANLVEDDNEED